LSHGSGKEVVDVDVVAAVAGVITFGHDHGHDYDHDLQRNRETILSWASR
jgi:hypothetical protein